MIGVQPEATTTNSTFLYQQQAVQSPGRDIMDQLPHLSMHFALATVSTNNRHINRLFIQAYCSTIIERVSNEINVLKIYFRIRFEN